MSAESPRYLLSMLVAMASGSGALFLTTVWGWRRGRLTLVVLLVASATCAVAGTAALQIRDWLGLPVMAIAVSSLLFAWEAWLALRVGREPWFHALSGRRVLRKLGIGKVSLAEVRDRYALAVLQAVASDPELAREMDEIATEIDKVVVQRLVESRGYVPSWALANLVSRHVRALEAEPDPRKGGKDRVALAALCMVAERRGLL